MVSGAMKIAASLRKLPVKKDVPCKLENRGQVESYLRETLDKKIPPERIRNEGRVYGLLGLIPLGMDYLNTIIKLYTDQLGGYYNPETDSYVMADWLPASMQMSIAVHELTHALQDQHFKLDDLMDEMKDDSDTLLARSAMVEGDATAVMLNYSRKEVGLSSIANEKDVSAFMMQNITGAMLSSGVSTAPQALQALLIFPYVSGLRFVHALLRTEGFDAVDRAFRNPPDSSEQILHPERYLSGKGGFRKPSRPKLTAYGIADDLQPTFDDRLGEFVTSTLLSSFVSPLQASRAASGWDGDRLWFFETGSRGPVLAWRTLWDSKADASEFADVVRQAYEKRFGATAQKVSGKSVFADTAVGKIEIVLSGSQVDLYISEVPAISGPNGASR